MTIDEEARLVSRAMGSNIESRELPSGAYEHVAKETPMTWTTEYPTKPGFYWVRNMRCKFTGLDAEARIVSVTPEYPTEFGPSDMQFYFAGNDVRWDRDNLISAEWYGPIEPPE